MWKCDYCQTENDINSETCSQCGSPRKGVGEIKTIITKTNTVKTITTETTNKEIKEIIEKPKDNSPKHNKKKWSLILVGVLIIFIMGASALFVSFQYSPHDAVYSKPTPYPTPSSTPTFTPKPTLIPTLPPTPISTPIPIPSSTPTIMPTPTITPSPIPTPKPTVTPSPIPTSTPTPTPKPDTFTAKLTWSLSGHDDRLNTSMGYYTISGTVYNSGNKTATNVTLDVIGYSSGGSVVIHKSYALSDISAGCTLTVAIPEDAGTLYAGNPISTSTLSVSFA
jgi:hypothetical protein